MLFSTFPAPNPCLHLPSFVLWLEPFSLGGHDTSLQLQFLMASDAYHCVSHLLATVYLCREMPITVQCPLWRFYCSLLFSYLGSLCIRDVNHLADVEFANILPHSAGCLFPRLVVSFAQHKLDVIPFLYFSFASVLWGLLHMPESWSVSLEFLASGFSVLVSLHPLSYSTPGLPLNSYVLGITEK